MAKKFWVLCAVIFLSANLVHAAESNTKESASPSPLFKDPTTAMEMVFVKGGCYQMGDALNNENAQPNEKPAHEVCVGDFYIGKYEVTQGQWNKLMGKKTSGEYVCDEDNCPASHLSFGDIQDFISKLNKKSEGNSYRLPTEAEWEYAARSGGKKERYSGGDDAESVAWHEHNSGRTNHPVGTKAPNGLGIYDMSGNVWEMTSDWYSDDYYANSPRENPKGPESGPGHVIRGDCSTGDMVDQRTTRRKHTHTWGDERDGSVGFRLLKIP